MATRVDVTATLIPDCGFLREAQIIGQKEVTEAEAERNREAKKGPRRPRPKIRPLVPVSKSTWWDGVRTGRFPKPVKFGRCTMWRVEDINALIESV